MQAIKDSGLKGFEEWLRQHGLVLGNRIPFVISWVERFLRLQATRSRESWEDTLRMFIQDLAEGQTLDWQMRQAAEAVTLYCGQFRVQDVTRVSQPDHTRDQPAAHTARDLLAEMRRLIQLRHYSPRTKRSYLGWARRFLLYLEYSGGVPTPDEVMAYLSYLATRRNVSSSTQNQAFSALLFLFRNVFHLELGDMGGTVRARRGAKLPVVLSVEETRSILGKLQGVTRLMLELVYGGGLRVSEVVILRVKDIDFDADTLDVRSGTGSAQSAGRAVTSNIKGVDRSLARARRSPAA